MELIADILGVYRDEYEQKEDYFNRLHSYLKTYHKFTKKRPVGITDGVWMDTFKFDVSFDGSGCMAVTTVLVNGQCMEITYEVDGKVEEIVRL